MQRSNGRKKVLLWALVLALVSACVALVACSQPKPASEEPASSAAESSAAASSATEEAASSAEATASDAGEIKVSAPTTIPEADEFGVITYDKWEDQYPLEVASYLANAYNVPGYVGEYAEITAKEPDTTSVGDIKATASDGKANFLDDDHYPEIKVIGKGYGYAKYYTEPGGHTYSIWSIEHNGRLGDVRGNNTKGILACYACKTPQIHFDAENNGGHEAWTLGAKNDEGVELTGWRTNASVGVDKYTQNVSCANCHVNDNPTEPNIIRQDWARVLGKAWDDNKLGISKSGIVCGQCHCDYSMALSKTDDEYSNGEPTSPYEEDTVGDLSNISPEKAMEFYDKHGIVDWTYASTGAKMLSIRHAEFEIYYVMDGGNPMFPLGYECKDCHMGVKEQDGQAYTSHTWVSPLDDPEIVANCDTCHSKDGGIEAYVKKIQEEIDGRNHELGERYADFIHNFESKVATMQDDPDNEGQQILLLDEAAAAENGIDADKLEKLQTIQRQACYYWNLPAADNSEGAHNTKLYNRCLDKLEELLNEGDELLGMESSAANFEAWNAEQAKAA